MAVPTKKWHDNLPNFIKSWENNLKQVLLGEKRDTSIYLNQAIGGNLYKEMEGMRYVFDDVKQYSNHTYLTSFLSSKTEFFCIFETYFSHYYDKMKEAAEELIRNYANNTTLYLNQESYFLSFSNYSKEPIDVKKIEEGFFIFMEKMESILSEFILNYDNVSEGLYPKFFMKTGIKNSTTEEILFMVTTSCFATNEVKVMVNSSIDFDVTQFEKDISQTIKTAEAYLSVFNEKNTAAAATKITHLLYKRAYTWGSGLKNEEVKLAMFDKLNQAFKIIENDKNNQEALFYINDENAVISVEQKEENNLFKDYGNFSLERIMWFGLYSTGVKKFKPEKWSGPVSPNNTFAIEAFSTINASRV